jgi:hypothetical protein
MSALLGGRQVCIFDQFCDPGLGAPIHSHAVEEVLEVIEGTAEIWLGKESAIGCLAASSIPMGPQT